MIRALIRVYWILAQVSGLGNYSGSDKVDAQPPSGATNGTETMVILMIINMSRLARRPHTVALFHESPISFAMAKLALQ